MPKKIVFVVFHDKDRKTFEWIKSEFFKRKLPKGVKPLFSLDDIEIMEATSTSNFDTETHSAMLVICSKSLLLDSKANQIIKRFKGTSDEVLPVVVDGSPYSSIEKNNSASEECFPQSLLYKIGPDGAISNERTEPLYTDIRKGAYRPRNAITQIKSGILKIDYRDLMQREKRRKNISLFFTFVVILPFVFLLLKWFSITWGQIRQGPMNSELDNEKVRESIDYMFKEMGRTTEKKEKENTSEL